MIQTAINKMALVNTNSLGQYTIKRKELSRKDTEGNVRKGKY